MKPLLEQLPHLQGASSRKYVHLGKHPLRYKGIRHGIKETEHIIERWTGDLRRKPELSQLLWWHHNLGARFGDAPGEACAVALGGYYLNEIHRDLSKPISMNPSVLCLNCGMHIWIGYKQDFKFIQLYQLT